MLQLFFAFRILRRAQRSGQLKNRQSAKLAPLAVR